MAKRKRKPAAEEKPGKRGKPAAKKRTAESSRTANLNHLDGLLEGELSDSDRAHYEMALDILEQE